MALIRRFVWVGIRCSSVRFTHVSTDNLGEVHQFTPLNPSGSRRSRRFLPSILPYIVPGAIFRSVVSFSHCWTASPLRPKGRHDRGRYRRDGGHNCKQFEHIEPAHAAFIAEQHIFFTASAAATRPGQHLATRRRRLPRSEPEYRRLSGPDGQRQRDRGASAGFRPADHHVLRI